MLITPHVIRNQQQALDLTQICNSNCRMPLWCRAHCRATRSAAPPTRMQTLRMPLWDSEWHARERGFALLIVFWSLVLIALLTTQLLASGRTSLRLAGNLRAAAEAGRGGRRDQRGAVSCADHRPRSLAARQHPASTACGRVQRLPARPKPRRQDQPQPRLTGLLSGLFQALGAAPDQAQHLANAIIAWRSNGGFQTGHTGAACSLPARRAALRPARPTLRRSQRPWRCD